MGRTHTGRTYTGGMNWGTGAVTYDGHVRNETDHSDFIACMYIDYIN